MFFYYVDIPFEMMTTQKKQKQKNAIQNILSVIHLLFYIDNIDGPLIIHLLKSRCEIIFGLNALHGRRQVGPREWAGKWDASNAAQLMLVLYQITSSLNSQFSVPTNTHTTPFKMFHHTSPLRDQPSVKVTAQVMVALGH